MNAIMNLYYHMAHMNLYYHMAHHLFILASILLLMVDSSAIRADDGSMNLGMADTKPVAGTSVPLDGQFMVSYTETIPGTDVEFEMIPVPAGTFMLGSPEDEPGRKNDEGPQLKVSVDPMWVAKTEVTWAQYKEYMKMYRIFKDFEARGQRIVNHHDALDAVTAPTELYSPMMTFEFGEDPEQAAVTMTRYSAQQFTKWLSLLAGRQYRLPTEAEWEYAARGGSQSAYSFGDDPAHMDRFAWFFPNSDGQKQVGTKQPNPFGLHDMHGNVAEWTVNQHTKNGYQDFVNQKIWNAIDVVNWPETQDNGVVRGGSWEMKSKDLRSAARMASVDDDWKDLDACFPNSPWWFTSDPSRGVGFRLFRSAKPLAEKKIRLFWEAGPQNVKDEVQFVLDSGRGCIGKVDKNLPEAIKNR